MFPSLFEGSAVVTYEALACGLPSIVTPDAGSVVRDGVEGFLVAPRDVEAWPRGIERLGGDPALREGWAARPAPGPWSSTGPATIAALVELVAEVSSRPNDRP